MTRSLVRHKIEARDSDAVNGRRSTGLTKQNPDANSTSALRSEESAVSKTHRRWRYRPSGQLAR